MEDARQQRRQVAQPETGEFPIGVSKEIGLNDLVVLADHPPDTQIRQRILHGHHWGVRLVAVDKKVNSIALSLFQFIEKRPTCS